ncbi:hypothetical protein [Rhodoplanes roseus]|uniref:Uncharacterized protein n=1 Tax=Rhodoplanes roseus TaxID=29409 RepID=A0A327KZ16_9BRAD|nr:hypothetical protein [Rhodoplanes roseus]RAI43989.1 hypothetical protein CH341_11465 [Rhodoplanes roseus]
MFMQISVPALPGAAFEDRQALIDHFHTDAEIERALAAYAADGCEPALWEDLGRLGFDRDEIAALAAAPGKRPARCYISALDG